MIPTEIFFLKKAYHLLEGQKEIADSSSKIKQRVPPKRSHLLTDSPQKPQIIINSNKGQSIHPSFAMHPFVHRQHLLEMRPFVRRDGNTRASFILVVNLKKVKEGVGRMGVVPAEGLQTELPVHEDDGVPSLEEVLCGGRATRALTRITRF